VTNIFFTQALHLSKNRPQVQELGIRFVHVKPLSTSTSCDSIRNNLTVCRPFGGRARRLRLLGAGAAQAVLVPI
jgi:hypothetical protein